MKIERGFLLALLIAGAVFAQEKVELSIGVTVAPERIEFKSLQYSPETVVTNRSYEWQTVVDIRTNLYYGMKPDEVVTNTVQQQVPVVTVVTNAARWTAPFEYTIPAGEPMLIAGALDARPQRKAVMDVQLTLSAADLRAVLGDDFYLQTQAAAETFGPLPVSGALREALRGAVLTAMQSGGAQ